MAQIPKSLLRKSLSVTELVDPQGLTPYVAIHLGERGKCHVRRTGAIGFVATIGAPGLSDPGWLYVGYAHLQDSLKYIESDDVNIIVAPNGGVVLSSVNATFDTEMHIHTVARGHSAFRSHDTGEVLMDLDPAWLRGLDTRDFPISVPPGILKDSLVLQTPYGVVQWRTTYDPATPSSPRASFLKAVSAYPEGVQLALTHRGYYRARLGDMELFTGGHQHPFTAIPLLGPALPGADLPAARLVQSLKFACGIAGPSASIQVSAKLGVTTRDAHGLPARFSLGETPAFPTATLSAKTAKLIVDAIGQDVAESASLHRLGGQVDKARMLRGDCSVSFPVFPNE